jgi:tetratricopeptide (TPR) repeat protein
MGKSWKTVRVFISSTFRDMHAERDYLINTIFPELQERMAERRLHLRAVDLRWGVLQEEDALDICLTAIEECRPFFIGLLGNRYGFIPPGSDDSITAREIFHGVLDSPGQQMVSFFYFRDPEVTARIPQPDWEVYNESEPSPRSKLDKLKQKIEDTGLPHRIYSCHWDDQQKSLTCLEELGRWILEDLWAAISRQFPAGAEEEAAEDPERLAADQFIESLVQHFVGRRALLDQLHQLARSGGVTCVTGPSGCGKSALLSKFCREFSQNNPDSAVLSHFTGATAASTQTRQMLSHFWNDLCQIADKKAEQPASLNDLTREFPTLLEKAGQTKPLCLVIDAINQFEDQEMGWLPEHLPPGISVVFSALECEALASLRKRKNPPLEVNVESLSEGEARDIIQHYLAQHLRKLTPGQISAFLSKSATRSPLYLLAALDELRLTGRFKTLETQIENLPDDIPGLFESSLARLEKEHGAELVKEFLSLIATGRGGQTEEDLRAMLTPPNEPRLPDLKWARLMRSLQIHLFRRSEFIDFFHQQFRQAVAKRYLPPEAASACHRRIAQYLTDRGPGYIITLQELPWHLRQGGMHKELYQLLEEPGFRQEKLTATNSVFQLCTDIGLALDAALEDDDIQHIARFGFLHADYHEGRIRKTGISGLFNRSLKTALEEVRLLRGGPRFRVLVLLAWQEAEAGRTTAADELIEEALSISRREAGKTSPRFIQAIFSSLLRHDCPHAIPFLEQACQCSGSEARLAAEIAPGLPTDVQVRLLEKAIEWLKRDFNDKPEATKSIQTFEAVADAVLRVQSPDIRDRLLASLQEVIGHTITFVESARSDMDRAMALILFQSLAEDPDSELFLANEWKVMMQATLGQAMIRQGLEQQGKELIEKAISGCGGEGVLSSAFGFMAKTLRRLPDELSVHLFGNLIANTRGPSHKANLESMLTALADEKRKEGLPEIASAIFARIMLMPVRDQANLLKKVAILYEKDGRRPNFSHLYLPAWLLPFVRLNLLIDAESKFRITGDALELYLLSQKTDPHWTDLRLQEMAELIPRADEEKRKIALLKRLFWLARRAGSASGLAAAVRSATKITPESAKTKALLRVLDECKNLPDVQATEIRRYILEVSQKLEKGKSRLAIWEKWAESVNANEVQELTALETALDDGLRAEGNTILAGAWTKLNNMDEARRTWLQAAIGEQAFLTRTNVYASAVAADILKQHNSSAKDAIRRPDPEIALRSVEIASAACSTPQHATLLEKEVSNWKAPWIGREERILMHLAVGQAWARAGNAARGAKFAWKGFRKYYKYSLTDDQFTAILQASALLAGQPDWLRAVFKIISTPTTNISKNPKRVAALADMLAQLPGDSFAKDALRQTYHCTLEGGKNAYKWRTAEAIAGISGGLARRGQTQLAVRLLKALDHALTIDNALDDEEEVLLPASQMSGRVAMAHAWEKIYENESSDTLFSVIDHHIRAAQKAGEEIKEKTQQPEVAENLVEIWAISRRLNMHNSEFLRLEAEGAVRELASQSMLGSSGDGYAAMARARAGFGEETEAFEAIRQIKDESRRESYLIDMARRLPLSLFSSMLHFWKEMPTATGRRNMAWETVKYLVQPGVPALAQPEEKDYWKWPRHNTLAPIAATAAAALLPYWLIWQYGWQAIRTGLSGPHHLWWIASLVVVILFIVSKVSHNMRDDVQNAALRIGLSLLLIPILPLLLIPDIYEFFQKQRRRAVHLGIYLRHRFSPEITHPIASTPRVDQDTLKKLLRAASTESEPFDLLLSGYMIVSRRAPDQDDGLPEMRIPNAPSEEAIDSKQEYEEIMRHERKIAIWRRKTAKALVKAGNFLSAALFFMPMMTLELVRQHLRTRKAYRLAGRGQKLLDRGKTERALRLLQRSVELHPEHPYFWNNLSIALQKLHRYDEAIDAQHQAIARNYGNPEVTELWYGLGYLCWTAGQNEEGIRAFEKVMELEKPGSFLYEEARRGKEYCIYNQGKSVS